MGSCQKKARAAGGFGPGKSTVGGSSHRAFYERGRFSTVPFQLYHAQPALHPLLLGVLFPPASAGHVRCVIRRGWESSIRCFLRSLAEVGRVRDEVPYFVLREAPGF